MLHKFVDSRAKLIQNMKTLLHEHVDEEWTVVYDLDQLMMEEKLKEKAENGNVEEDGRRTIVYNEAPKMSTPTYFDGRDFKRWANFNIWLSNYP